MTKEQNDNVVLGRNERGEETITFRVEDLTTYGVLGADGTEFRPRSRATASISPST